MTGPWCNPHRKTRRMSIFAPLSFLLRGFVVSGAEREAAVMLSYPHTQTSELERIEAKIAEKADSFTDADPVERERLHQRYDVLADRRQEARGCLMARFVISTEPVPADVAGVYQRRGMSIPLSASPAAPAATWSYKPRLAHKLYANAFGYFWLPCVLCRKTFGGHEITDTIPDPTRGEGCGVMICPACTAERNGGRV